MPQNHYSTLNVVETASLLEIKIAFKDIVLQNDPDRTVGLDEQTRTNREEICKKANAAWEGLSVASRRAEYDASLRREARPAPEPATAPKAKPTSSAKPSPNFQGDRKEEKHNEKEGSSRHECEQGCDEKWYDWYKWQDGKCSPPPQPQPRGPTIEPWGPAPKKPPPCETSRSARRAARSKMAHERSQHDTSSSRNPNYACMTKTHDIIQDWEIGLCIPRIYRLAPNSWKVQADMCKGVPRLRVSMVLQRDQRKLGARDTWWLKEYSRKFGVQIKCTGAPDAVKHTEAYFKDDAKRGETFIRITLHAGTVCGQAPLAFNDPVARASEIVQSAKRDWGFTFNVTAGAEDRYWKIMPIFFSVICLTRWGKG